MQLTTFTDYGLRALMYLQARQESICTVRAIADDYGISRHHMVKVVHRLGQLGYVESLKGKGGGIRLSRDAGGLRLGDLVAKLEANMHMVECFDPETNHCRITEVCRLKHYLKDASDAFITELNKRTLADAAGDVAFFNASLSS
jgi:Rrf2 family nitric oxide-sensitive transcriptional repressor